MVYRNDVITQQHSVQWNKVTDPCELLFLHFKFHFLCFYSFEKYHHKHSWKSECEMFKNDWMWISGVIWFSSIQFNFFNTITYGRKDLFLMLNREHASFPPSRSQLYLNSAKRLLKAGVCSCVWLVANLLKVQSEGWTLSDRSLELR